MLIIATFEVVDSGQRCQQIKQQNKQDKDNSWISGNFEECQFKTTPPPSLHPLEKFLVLPLEMGWIGCDGPHIGVPICHQVLLENINTCIKLPKYV